jgi:hypothetical protein
MNLYSLISNYETNNKYIKHLNICAHLFNVVETIIRIQMTYYSLCQIL